jgi:predicted DNA-binding transcriptional regulator AlpA
LLHEADAGRYIGMSVAFLRQARVRARGPAYVRVGRSVRYRLSDLDAWLSERRVTTRDQAE